MLKRVLALMSVGLLSSFPVTAQHFNMPLRPPVWGEFNDVTAGSTVPVPAQNYFIWLQDQVPAALDAVWSQMAPLDRASAQPGDIFQRSEALSATRGTGRNKQRLSLLYLCESNDDPRYINYDGKCFWRLRVARPDPHQVTVDELTPLEKVFLITFDTTLMTGRTLEPEPAPDVVEALETTIDYKEFEESECPAIFELLDYLNSLPFEMARIRDYPEKYEFKGRLWHPVANHIELQFRIDETWIDVSLDGIQNSLAESVMNSALETVRTCEAGLATNQGTE